MTLFEKIIARELEADIVYEDDQCLAFKDNNPQAPIHVLIVPKRVIPRIGEASEDDAALLGHLLVTSRTVAEKMGVSSTDEGFRLVINHGRNGGESVPHLHVHLLAGRPLKWPPG